MSSLQSGHSGLRPLDLKIQPATYTERFKMVKKLFILLSKLKIEVSGPLERFAVELEAAVASCSGSTQGYRFNLTVLCRDVTRSKNDISAVKLSGKPLPSNVLKYLIVKAPTIAPIDLKESEVLGKLEELLIAVDILKKNGFITERCPESRTDFVTYVECARCSTKFDKANIMQPTLCKYHTLKKVRSPRDKTVQYPCCGETADSPSMLRLGCKELKYHVFRGETYNELRNISEFSSTAEIDGEHNVLALDCEMAFTSMGYEMIRLTIVDFFSLQVLFDEIVKPIGEVIDLNSEFSGVHEIDETKALSFQETISRILCNHLINKNTIILGHGLENDLNVMRLIHTRVLDTAILYSKGRFKNSLKNLSFEILDRRIQSGEHDSAEDAIATMDIIKKKLGIPLDKRDW